MSQTVVDKYLVSENSSENHQRYKSAHGTLYEIKHIGESWFLRVVTYGKPVISRRGGVRTNTYHEVFNNYMVNDSREAVLEYMYSIEPSLIRR